MSEANFRLGQLYITQSVHSLFKEENSPEDEVLRFLSRHAAGDWGELDEYDCKANEDALASGDRILSAYRTASGVKIWIVTEEANEDGMRSGTTILLPEDY